MPNNNHVSTLIIGGGITGLAAGFFLKQRHGQDDFLVLEAAPKTGGNIDTTREDGFTVEHGPNGFLDNVPETLALAEALGLSTVRSDDAARKRFLICRGKPVRVPEGGLAFLRSPLLSLPGRFRVFGEPFARKRPPGDETVFNFAARRIGPEAAEVLVDTMVKGVFAGDSRALSLKSAFPKMADMEARHGSLVRAMLAKMAKRLTGHRDAKAGGPAGPGGVLTSFQGGLSTLIQCLSDQLAGRIETSAEVMALRHERGTFQAITRDRTYTAGKVLLAVPAPQAAAILDRSLPAAAGLLRQIPSSPVTVAAMAFDRAAFPHPLDGFGFLVPDREKSCLLGCLWTSSIFPGRAPDGKVLLRAMLGGMRQPNLSAMPDERLLVITQAALKDCLGTLPLPDKHWIFRYPNGIAQYPPGHGDRLKALSLILDTMPGLCVAGNAYEGISVNLCIVQAKKAAKRLAT